NPFHHRCLAGGGSFRLELYVSLSSGQKKSFRELERYRGHGRQALLGPRVPGLAASSSDQNLAGILSRVKGLRSRVRSGDRRRRHGPFGRRAMEDHGGRSRRGGKGLVSKGGPGGGRDLGHRFSWEFGLGF